MTDLDTSPLDPDHEARLRTHLEARANRAGDVDARAALAAVYRAQVPDLHQRRRRRRVAWLAGVAATVVIAVGAVLVVQARDDDSVVRTRPDAPEISTHLAPTVWPEGIDGPTEAIERSPLPDDFELGRWILRRNGTAVAAATLSNWPLPGTNPLDGSTALTVGGHFAVWRPSDGYLTVALLPGRTVTLHSATLDQAELEQLVAVFDHQDGSTSETDLPDGWTLEDDSYGLGAIPDGIPLQGTERVARYVDGLPQVLLSYRQVDDAQAAIDTLIELGGPTLDQRNSPTGGPAVLVPIADSTEPRGIVWAVSDHVLAQLFSNSLSADTLVPTLESIGPVDEATWRTYLVKEPETDHTTVDGFQLLDGETQTGAGDYGGAWRWMLTVAPQSVITPDMPTVDQVDRQLVTLHVLDRRGRELSSPREVLDGVGCCSYARSPDIVVVAGFAPSGTTDLAITAYGRQHAPIVVPMPNGQPTYVAAILNTPVTPDLSGTPMRITGTLPDGTTYDSTNPAST